VKHDLVRARVVLDELVEPSLANSKNVCTVAEPGATCVDTCTRCVTLE